MENVIDWGQDESQCLFTPELPPWATQQFCFFVFCCFFSYGFSSTYPRSSVSHTCIGKKRLVCFGFISESAKRRSSPETKTPRSVPQVTFGREQQPHLQGGETHESISLASKHSCEEDKARALQPGPLAQGSSQHFHILQVGGKTPECRQTADNPTRSH